MNDWVVLIVIFATVFISGPLIAVLHELGHAFAYLLITKPGRVDVFIGSYGDVKNSLRFKYGKLHFFVKRSFPFVKGVGLCRSSKAETNYIYDIIILLADPVFTLVSAALFALIVVNAGASLLLVIIGYILLGFSALSLIQNLAPH